MVNCDRTTGCLLVIVGRLLCLIVAIFWSENNRNTYTPNFPVVNLPKLTAINTGVLITNPDVLELIGNQWLEYPNLKHPFLPLHPPVKDNRKDHVPISPPYQGGVTGVYRMSHSLNLQAVIIKFRLVRTFSWI